MLPSALVSTYEQYKQDTNSIAAWLALTAKSLGFSAELSPARTAATSTRLKGKARTQAKKQAAAASANRPPGTKYIINIKDFVSLAEYVAAKSAPVPSSFGTTIDRVIAARSLVGSKINQYGRELDETSDAKHQYFVGGKLSL